MSIQFLINFSHFVLNKNKWYLSLIDQKALSKCFKRNYLKPVILSGHNLRHQGGSSSHM